MLTTPTLRRRSSATAASPELCLADAHGHGTHVAGIVGARRDGAGMHGGAFDSQLLIGKVAVGRNYDFNLARQAAAWGRDQDSVAINVSAAYLRDPLLESRLVRLGG